MRSDALLINEQIRDAINAVLNRIITEIADLDTITLNDNPKKVSTYVKLSDVREVIDKHSLAESEVNEE